MTMSCSDGRRTGGKPRPSPQRRCWPVRFALHLAVDQVALQLAPHFLGSVAAHANEPDTAGRQSLDCRNADLLIEARRNHLGLIQGHQKHPAHGLVTRLAAAIASLALV